MELLVLRHENAVSRRQAGRVRYQPTDGVGAENRVTSADLVFPYARGLIKLRIWLRWHERGLLMLTDTTGMGRSRRTAGS